MTDNYNEYTSKMEKTITALSSQFDSVRAGRANAAVLDRVAVDYYGQSMPIAQIATISSPDPRSLVIQPWDASTLKSVEKAIQVSDLGINPQNDGRVIRLVFPQLTEERRKDLIKQIKKYSEEAKVAIRNIRRDALEVAKEEKKKSIITEDDLKNVEKDLKDITDKYTAQIDKVCANKEKELLEI